MRDFLHKKSDLLEQVQFVAATALVIGLSINNKMNPSQVLMRTVGFIAVDLLVNRLLMWKYYSPYNPNLAQSGLNESDSISDDNALSCELSGVIIIPQGQTLCVINKDCREFLKGNISFKNFDALENVNSIIKKDLVELQQWKAIKDLLMLCVAIPFAFTSLQSKPMTLMQSAVFFGAVAFLKDFISCNVKFKDEPVLLHNNLFQSVMQSYLFKGIWSGYEKYAQTFISSHCYTSVAKCLDLFSGALTAAFVMGLKELVSDKFKTDGAPRNRMSQGFENANELF